MKINTALLSSFILFSIAKVSGQTRQLTSKSLSDSLRMSLLVSPINYSSSNNNLTWHQMFTNVPHDIVSFPSHAFNKKNIPLITSLALGTGTLMLVDERGWNFNSRLFHQSKTFHKLSDIGVSLGEAKYHLIMAGLFSAIGFTFNSRRSLKTASNLVEVMLASGISAQILKRVFGRESPAAASEYTGDWTFFPGIDQYQDSQPKYYSYPSGHITTLTASITVIANNYPEQKWIKPVGYSLMALCSVGLVSRGMHWYSDLPAGFFLGYTFGNIIAPEIDTKANNKKEKTKNELSLLPLIDFNDVGISLSYSF